MELMPKDAEDKVMGDLEKESPSIISSHSRRMDFEGYLNALTYPMTQERCALRSEFIRSLYDLKPELLMRAGGDSDYLKMLVTILEGLREGRNPSQAAAMKYIEDSTTMLNLPMEKEKNLKPELLTLWRINKLSLAYFGDVITDTDGSFNIFLAQHLIRNKILNEAAMDSLLFESRSASTGEDRLFYYLLKIDINSAFRHLTSLLSGGNEVTVGCFRLKFHREKASRLYGKGHTDTWEFYHNSRKVAEGVTPNYRYPDNRRDFWIGCEILRVCEEASLRLAYGLGEKITRVTINDSGIRGCRPYLDCPNEIPYPFLTSGAYRSKTPILLVIDVESVNETLEAMREAGRPADRFRIKIETVQEGTKGAISEVTILKGRLSGSKFFFGVDGLSITRYKFSIKEMNGEERIRAGDKETVRHWFFSTLPS